MQATKTIKLKYSIYEIHYLNRILIINLSFWVIFLRQFKDAENMLHKELSIIFNNKSLKLLFDDAISIKIVIVNVIRTSIGGKITRAIHEGSISFIYISDFRMCKISNSWPLCTFQITLKFCMFSVDLIFVPTIRAVAKMLKFIIR